MLRKLIADAQLGDKQSMEELIFKFRPLIKKYAYKLNYEDAQSDLTLFFIELIRAFPAEVLDTADERKITKYIFVSIKNHYNHLIKDFIRRKNEICLSQLSEEQSYHLESRFAVAQEDPFERIFIDLSSFLSQRELRVIIQIYYLGYSAAEIARREACSRQAVNQLKRRALKKIRDRLVDINEN